MTRCNRPHDGRIHLVVLVPQPVAYVLDIRPSDVGVLGEDIRRDMPHGFGNDGDPALDDPLLVDVRRVLGDLHTSDMTF